MPPAFHLVCLKVLESSLANVKNVAKPVVAPEGAARKCCQCPPVMSLDSAVVIEDYRFKGIISRIWQLFEDRSKHTGGSTSTPAATNSFFVVAKLCNYIAR